MNKMLRNIFRNFIPLFIKNRIVEMTIFITDKCNFKCKHCFMLPYLNKLNTYPLSLKEFQFMGKYIKSMQRVHIGGGEPLIRKDIAEIILTIANQWDTQVICLPTNGSFQKNSEKVALLFGLKSRKNLRFHFSLSVMGEEMSSFTSYPKAFKLWDKTVKRVKKITDKFENISLTVLSTFNNFNQDRIDDFVAYIIKQIQPDDFSFALVRSHKNYNPNLDLKKFADINHVIHSRSKNHNSFIRAYRELIREKIAQYYKEKHHYVDCNSGKLRVVLSPDGYVYPCETLGYPEGANPEDWSMGNIRDYKYNIHKLLKSKKSILVRKRIKENKCHCHHGIDMSINYLCTWKFKFNVILLGFKYFIRK